MGANMTRRATRWLLLAFVILVFAPNAGAQPDDPRVFRTVIRKSGQDGVHTYRIPGLATTPRGTLLAVFDIRHKSSGDLPGDIDVGLLRSTDNGETWGKMQTIMDYDADEPNSRGNGVGDPSILVDQKTGTIFVAALWSHGARAWFGSGPGLTPAETAQFVITKSTDDGLTWSKPESITTQIKPKEWKLCFQGPGSGIQLRDGTLVFPAQFKAADGVAHSCFIASEDQGKTWKISPPAIPGKPPTSESAIAELDDGSLLLSMRDEGRSGQRAWSRWEHKGKLLEGAWSKEWYTVPDPTCMASLIRYPNGPLIFANPNSAKRRVALTVRTSDDGGKTWSDGKLLEAGGAMYSCLTVLKDGRIGILYESVESSGLVFARFPLEWVTDQRKLSWGKPFTDHLVLQRDRAIPIWGTTEPGTEVTVRLAGRPQEVVAKADATGRWQVQLGPLPASAEPSELTVATSFAKRVCRDVVVGDVWVCAGQSNMEFGMAGEAHAAEELPNSGLPNLRLCNWNYAGQGFYAKPFGTAEIERLNPEKFYSGTWQRSAPETARGFSAVGYYFGRELQNRLPNLPIGLIHLAVGGSPTEAWIRREALAGDLALKEILAGNWLENRVLDDWCRERGHQNVDTALKGGWNVKDALGPPHPFAPTFLWDCGMSKLIPLGIRGVIWYQGESNSLSLPRVQQHEKLFPLLVADWRKQWGQGDFPFYFCQLASISTAKGYHSEYWAEFRDGQRRMLATIPNCGMAVTSDIGHPTDVHPRDKRTVGQRLAACALAGTYQIKVPYSGPVPLAARTDGAKVVVNFEQANELKTMKDEPARGFELAGADGKFYAASVTLQKSAATLECRDVQQPRTVRYGWQPYSLGNLYNESGLPASTFQLTVGE